jgi:hypothetical protein
MTKWVRWISVLLFLAAACQPKTESPVEVSPQNTVVPVVQNATAVPTARPISSRTPTLPPTVTLTLSPTATVTMTPTITLTPTDTLTPSITPTLEKRDHYLLSRPIARDKVDWLDRTYPYGWTQYDTREVHHGVEFVNPRFTAVLAAADGTVVYAGDDVATLFGPVNNYYGNLVVIEHGFTSPEGQPVFTLYGHLQRVEVQTGQSVSQGETIGVIGDSGIAIGPHLHFEVRVGDSQDFGATRNPDLWIIPYPKYGTLAGKITNAAGEIQYGAVIQVKSTDDLRYAFSYADDSVNSDPTWKENYTLGDLPEGAYQVVVSNRNGRVFFRESVTIQSGHTTWLDIQVDW